MYSRLQTPARSGPNGSRVLGGTFSCTTDSYRVQYGSEVLGTPAPSICIQPRDTLFRWRKESQESDGFCGLQLPSRLSRSGQGAASPDVASPMLSGPLTSLGKEMEKKTKKKPSLPSVSFPPAFPPQSPPHLPIQTPFNAPMPSHS